MIVVAEAVMTAVQDGYLLRVRRVEHAGGVNGASGLQLGG